MEKPDSSFRENVIILFACSGASKAGELTDIAARKLHKKGDILMSCPPAVSGRIDSYLEKLKRDHKVIALDGCKKNCLARTLDIAGFSNYLHLNIKNLGMTRKEATVDADTVEKVCKYVLSAMNEPSVWEKFSFSYNPDADRLRNIKI